MRTKSIDIKTIKKIIISRTDNIGDVILSLPLAAIIKQYNPNCDIIFLARNYVKAVVEQSPYVDAFIDWQALSALDATQVAEVLTEHKADAIIHLFPNRLIAKSAKKANIQHRIANSRRYYHYFNCNHLVSVKRRSSHAHEAQLNLRLLKAFDLAYPQTLKELIPLTKLNGKHTLDAKFQPLLDHDNLTIMVHPGSNGNTHEWPVNKFRECVSELHAAGYQVLLTGSEKEAEKFKETLINHCPNAINLMGKLSLEQFVTVMANVDGIIASSTGPLHMGAALGINALGIFPPCPGKDPSRWSPIGERAHYLVAGQTCNNCKTTTNCDAMNQVTNAMVLNKVVQWEKIT